MRKSWQYINEDLCDCESIRKGGHGHIWMPQSHPRYKPLVHRSCLVKCFAPRLSFLNFNGMTRHFGFENAAKKKKRFGWNLGFFLLNKEKKRFFFKRIRSNLFIVPRIYHFFANQKSTNYRLNDILCRNSENPTGLSMHACTLCVCVFYYYLVAKYMNEIIEVHPHIIQCFFHFCTKMFRCVRVWGAHLQHAA